MIRKFLPNEVFLPDIKIPVYDKPCVEDDACRNFMCNNILEGIVPNPEKIAFP